MICKHCLKDVTQYGTLGYCAQCGEWYKAEGVEIEGVYTLCSTKDDAPEKCDPFVQSLLMKGEELPKSVGLPIAPTSMSNIHKADKICVSCANKHFIQQFFIQAFSRGTVIKLINECLDYKAQFERTCALSIAYREKKRYILCLSPLMLVSKGSFAYVPKQSMPLDFQDSRSLYPAYLIRSVERED